MVLPSRAGEGHGPVGDRKQVSNYTGLQGGGLGKGLSIQIGRGNKSYLKNDAKIRHRCMRGSSSGRESAPNRLTASSDDASPGGACCVPNTNLPRSRVTSEKKPYRAILWWKEDTQASASKLHWLFYVAGAGVNTSASHSPASMPPTPQAEL